uniref:Putative ovule protein n=1 Tax=Solanum chacoense TaxID=4108 RepID=A0A0V0GRK0_SOLCH
MTQLVMLNLNTFLPIKRNTCIAVTWPTIDFTLWSNIFLVLDTHTYHTPVLRVCMFVSVASLIVF